MDDPHDLDRFLQAQKADYEQALAELKDGQKRTHWIWYIFPQLSGLGLSTMSQRYSIKTADEARAYLAHPILGRRLLDCTAAVLAHPNRSAKMIMGAPDDLKLRSCATLFASITNSDSAFHQLLAKYYGGEPDPETLRLLKTPQA